MRRRTQACPAIAAWFSLWLYLLPRTMTDDLFKIIRDTVSDLKLEAEQDSSLSGHRFTAEDVQTRSEELDGIELKEIENALHQISKAGGGIVPKGLGATGRKFWGFGITRRVRRRPMTGRR